MMVQSNTSVILSLDKTLIDFTGSIIGLETPTDNLLPTHRIYNPYRSIDIYSIL